MSFAHWNSAKVLDHGFVHLRDSMPMAQVNTDGLGSGDFRIEEAARVSTMHLPPAIRLAIGSKAEPETRTLEQTKKLIKYMFDHAHTSPFEQVRFTFVVKLPIFVARQWIRHRTGSFNEQSARYSKLPCEFYVPELERMQAQSTANKQGSAEQLSDADAHMLRSVIRGQSDAAYKAYEFALDTGLTRELARMVLPTNFYTEWYWTTDLHNFLGFCRQRCDAHAQYEIRVYAHAMLAMVEHVAPYTVSLFREKHGIGGADV